MNGQNGKRIQTGQPKDRSVSSFHHSFLLLVQVSAPNPLVLNYSPRATQSQQRNTAQRSKKQSMETKVVGLLSEGWIDLSDAFALRCVSKNWREALNKADDDIWEKLIDNTHGREIANSLRRSSSSRKGYELARHIYSDNENDAQTSALQRDDIACLIEFSSLDSGRKILMASFFASRLDWDVGRGGFGLNSSSERPTISIPNLFWPGLDFSEHQVPDIMNESLTESIEVRATLFRRDTQQRLTVPLYLVEGTDLEIDDVAQGEIYKYHGRLRSEGCYQGWCFVVRAAPYWGIADYEQQIRSGPTVKVDVHHCDLDFRFTDRDPEIYPHHAGSCGSLGSIGELLVLIDGLAWK